MGLSINNCTKPEPTMNLGQNFAAEYDHAKCRMEQGPKMSSGFSSAQTFALAGGVLFGCLAGSALVLFGANKKWKKEAKEQFETNQSTILTEFHFAKQALLQGNGLSLKVDDILSMTKAYQVGGPSRGHANLKLLNLYIAILDHNLENIESYDLVNQNEKDAEKIYKHLQEEVGTVAADLFKECEAVREEYLRQKTEAYNPFNQGIKRR